MATNYGIQGNGGYVPSDTDAKSQELERKIAIGIGFYNKYQKNITPKKELAAVKKLMAAAKSRGEPAGEKLLNATLDTLFLPDVVI